METKVTVTAKEESTQMKRTDKKELSTPEDFTSPEALYQKLIETVRSYHPSTDLSMIEKAYRLADEAHKGQLRKSGEPYIIHPICVAILLAELELDKETIIAGILHDVVEDTEYTLEDITEMFGSEIALLVDGVTKLTQLNYSKDKVELQAENLRKMFLAMAKDIRVILIKLADRLHNLRTLQYQKPEKQIEKARETMDIYAPLAQRLGISKIKIELDDLSLRYLEPEVCKELEEKIELRKDERTKFINGIIEEVGEHIRKVGIQAEISGRVKHFFSIYKKMVNQNKTLDQIYDLFAVRIIVNNLKDCYAALGVIHEMYKPIPGRFKDYIAMPKANMYQSLHTTLIGPNGTPFEIQIRTFDMHRTAEYGIAAHWKYKETQGGGKTSDTEEEKLAWLRQILEWQQEMSDSKEFLSSIKDDLDLFSDRIYCFTPTGDVKNLPAGSCPVDFAYAIHSAVGNKMVGARVNGKLVPIEHQLQNGDRIEIITSQNAKGPSRDWLAIVKSTQAKNKINQWFKTELKEDNILHGKELLIAYCKTKGFSFAELTKPEFMDICMRKYGFRDWDSVLAAVGHGALKEGQVINRLREEYSKKAKREVTDEKILESVGTAKEVKPLAGKAKTGITVQGAADMAVHLSKCCSPVPGDEIIGFVTRGRGISIHRTDCVNIIHASEDDRHRMISVEWNIPEDTKASESYFAEITIYANNRSGVLMDISKIFTENKIDIASLTSRTSKQGTATITVGFRVKGKEQLQYLITKIGSVESVLDVERTTG
ncbi:MAG: bifunctional (p)ppGpp synthetase/guanosine-3',5'-bis(diphosphate) 3'-pyrophosphohydrolase [Lachnospiraceae bacterium]|nr:bifunctional (p)ppGpp synthetase/guanosine-3',5'-bis(diphosphate) 3'-pyrophosphohydrolase [Lachnospiraceae bacterium]